MTARAWWVIVLLAFAIVCGSAMWLRCEGEAPLIEAPEGVKVGRKGASLSLRATDPGSGLRSLEVSLRHAGGELALADEFHPGNLFTGAALRPAGPVQVQLDPKAQGLKEGDAFLVVRAVDWSWADLFRGNEATLEVPVSIDLRAPRVHVESGLTYVHRGGSAAVVYNLGEAAGRDGVQIGDEFFSGFPFPGEAPGGAGRRFAVFAIPRNAKQNPRIRVVAEDQAGNQTSSGWSTRLRERKFDDVRINLSQRFMSNKVAELSEILGIDEEDPVAAFQKINTEVRAANERRIAEIIRESSPERMWSGAFSQLRNSAVTSRFAEHRSYFLEGEQISEAIHYGYDLASTAGAPIEAANAGRVLFAEELGIYGNCVILDHGLGVASLYAHLSQIDVEADERVAKNQVLGRSGATGLAGGDHLHFAILVGGVYVDPKEWWDPKWVREHVEVRLEK